ncbi:MAG: right-handed parallel beta-helix repeat-containing protein, partial [Candidatus Hydrogenedentes bacterium]|nr:right-handed parallel beta-helix repeat-containing protein [Candidatus Hydrogenedentota bacterium]
GEPGAGNVISGNGYRGIAVSATDNVVIQANFIGTDKTGTRALPNSDSGIGLEDAPSNLVGGTGPGEGNLISGNIDDGIVIYEAFPSFPPSATGNRIEGNLIGTDVTGSFAIPNSFMGVFITRGATGNIVGGEAPGARNVISGNGVDGVRIARPGTEGNVVENNLIGPDASGFPLGNNNSGILIVEGAANNLIGGAAATARNIITSNRMYGVEVNGPNTIQNTIQANSIFRNDHEGIILNFTGNTDLEAPTLTGIFPVRGTAVADARVEIFVDTEDEGEIFLGAAPSDAAGDFAVNLELASYAGRHLTATATDVFGNTSAFGVPLELEPPIVTGHPVDLTVVEGEPWGMSITAAGTETILYQWQYSDGASPFVDMADSGAVSGSLTPQLQSSAAVIPDEGFYRCVITNGIGEASESASAFLRVIPLDTRSAAVNTLDDVTDGDVDSVPQLIARPGADGFISLREMILASNNMNGTNEILFDVSGLILLQSVLPAVQDLTGGTVIEGNGDVTIDGSQLTGARDGVTLTSGQNFLSGLNIVNFPQHGVALRGVDAAANIVRGCMIGGIDQGNAKRGIVIVDGAAANVIGGANVDDRNVISGNGIGGVLVIGAGTADNQIAGNYIGTDSTGRVAVGNGGPGIAVASSATDTIAGGPNIGERNVISGNSGAGILVSGAGTNGNEIQGNYIGVDVNGDPGLPNTSHGVSIADGAINNAVGGTNASERNLIAGNGGNGVTINGGATLLNPVRQNSIHSNVGAGIGLLNGGDANLPAPVLNGVNSVINTAPANATVDLFVDDAEEGRIFVASLVANAGGQFTVNTDLTPYAGMNLTATATLGGNTSEFSAALPLDPPVVTDPPQDINRVEGEPFGFAVTVSGTEELMYQWQFAASNGNFSDIAEGGNFSGTTTASLAGAAARLTDAGLYRCLVTNRIGEVVPSSPGALVVIAAATAEAAVSTLDDGADGNTSSIAHTIAYPGADGEISLREAILAANNSGGANTIRFDVEGAILPAVQLPALSDASGGTVIDGGGVVLLDGSNLGGSANGLILSSANNALTGLTIIRFPGNGVRITGPGATGNSVLGCIIGSNGVVSRANGLDGVRIDSGAAGNLIGGPAGDDRNVLSGNAGNGVQIMGAGSDGNVISNNYLGTDATGLAALANGAAGVRISSGAAFNTVGGSEAARNVISA